MLLQIAGTECVFFPQMYLLSATGSKGQKTGGNCCDIGLWKQNGSEFSPVPQPLVCAVAAAAAVVVEAVNSAVMPGE